MDTQRFENTTQSCLRFTPRIEVTSARVAEALGISIEKAEILLRSPEAQAAIKNALNSGIQNILLTTFQQLARGRWPSIQAGPPMIRLTQSMLSIPLLDGLRKEE